MYKNFKNIKLEETGLFSGNPNKMTSYKILNEQGIYNLSDLFMEYDNNTIDYGVNTGILGVYEATETKGVVELLRYKFLNKNLEIDPLINLSEMVFNRERNNVLKYLQSIGLSQRVSIISYSWIENQIDKQIKLIDLLKELENSKIYNGYYPKYFQSTFSEKIRILLDYSNKHLKKSDDEENKWFEIMDEKELNNYRENKKEEVEEVFYNVDWSTYNDAMLLDDDDDFKSYIKLKQKIKEKTM